MIRIRRTDQSNPGFKQLVALLDKELAIRDGDDHAFYDQFNRIDNLDCVVLAEDDETPLGCGAFKELDQNMVEVKRMFVLEVQRGRGIAKTILAELEAWASEKGYAGIRLETGKKQPEAMALYQAAGYQKIPNYGPYAGIENSVCFEKAISGTGHEMSSTS